MFTEHTEEYMSTFKVETISERSLSDKLEDYKYQNEIAIDKLTRHKVSYFDNDLLLFHLIHPMIGRTFLAENTYPIQVVVMKDTQEVTVRLSGITGIYEWIKGNRQEVCPTTKISESQNILGKAILSNTLHLNDFGKLMKANLALETPDGNEYISHLIIYNQDLEPVREFYSKFYRDDYLQYIEEQADKNRKQNYANGGFENGNK